MNNLIMNSRWAPGPNGGPMYFSGQLATYDDLCIDGFRTCSITIPEGSDAEGIDQYDPPIVLCNRNYMNWGYIIRAVDAESIVLAAAFYDAGNNLIDTVTCDITGSVSCHFTRQLRRFPIPCDASYVHLSMHFAGKVTACTFYAPTAFFS